MIINRLVFNLKKKLATKVKGKVYASYIENRIHVSIENSHKDMVYHNTCVIC